LRPDPHPLTPVRGRTELLVLLSLREGCVKIFIKKYEQGDAMAAANFFL
jgi:hypothetical protein